MPGNRFFGICCWAGFVWIPAAPASRTGTLGELPQLYEQAEELLYLADMEGLECVMRYEKEGWSVTRLVDYQAIRDAASYEQILFGLHLACLKLRLMGREQEELERYFTIVWKMLAGDAPTPRLTLAGFADALAELVGYPPDGQYFSRIFRKVCGISPKEYWDSL